MAVARSAALGRSRCAEADRRQVQVVRQLLHSGGGVGLPQTTAGGGSAAKSQRSQQLVGVEVVFGAIDS